MTIFHSVSIDTSKCSLKQFCQFVGFFRSDLVQLKVKIFFKKFKILIEIISTTDKKKFKYDCKDYPGLSCMPEKQCDMIGGYHCEEFDKSCPGKNVCCEPYARRVNTADKGQILKTNCQKIM